MEVKVVIKSNFKQSILGQKIEVRNKTTTCSYMCSLFCADLRVTENLEVWVQWLNVPLDMLFFWFRYSKSRIEIIFVFFCSSLFCGKLSAPNASHEWLDTL